MVDEEIVMDTIRKMKASGLETPIMISTLQDIGYTEEQAKEFIARAESGSPPKQPEPRPASTAQPSLQQPTLQPRAPVQQSMPQQPAQPIPAQPTATAQQPPAMTPQPLRQPVLQQASRSPFPQAQSTQQLQQPVQAPQQPVLPQGAFQQPQPQIPPELKVHLAERSEEDAMRHAQTQAMLAEQTQSISEMQKTVQKAAKKIEKIKPIKLPPGTSAGIKALALELESLRKDVEETRAMASATKTLMEKILEVNRKILGRLP